MDIFNRKRVEELTQELFLKDKDLLRLRSENTDLRNLLDVAENELKKVIAIKETVPEGCIPGKYCKACEFGKSYFYRNYSPSRLTSIQGVTCSKGESCKNFVQKEN